MMGGGNVLTRKEDLKIIDVYERALKRSIQRLAEAKDPESIKEEQKCVEFNTMMLENRRKRILAKN